MQSIPEQLRQAIKSSPRSRRSIALQAGVRESTLADFMQDRREGLIGTIEDLTEALGMEWKLVPKEPQQ